MHVFRSLLLLLVTILALLLSADANAGVRELVCELLDLDCDDTDDSTIVRDPSKVGQRIMIADLKTGRERPLWECVACWSPIALSRSHLAVVRIDGVWKINIRTGQAESIYDATGVYSLVGVTRKRELLLIRGRPMEGELIEVTYVLEAFDLRNGTTRVLVENVRPADVPITKHVRKRKTLFALSMAGFNSPIMIKKFGSLEEGKPILPTDAVVRFDPFWLKDGRVGYLALSQE